jgi:ribosomal protein S18 acetylase RimI-like enzyme
MAEIRKAVEEDKPAVWSIMKAVIAGGDTYVFDPETSEEEMLAYWFSPEKHVYVVEDGGKVLGTYWLKSNQPGLGDHIGNGAYMVSPDAKGKGIGKLMALHSIDEGKRIGYHAIQFNFVVKSNTAAVNLWKSVGFEVIGEIPDAIRHSKNGLTNAYIMYRKL